MCTRYYIDNTDPSLIPIIEEAERSPLYNRFLLEARRKITTSGEVFPTDIVPVIARTETASAKPFFREG